MCRYVEMKKIIIDCDPGMDDSVAIIMAMKSKSVEVLAVTTVSGNYPVDVTSTNALKIMGILGKSVPVAKGMSHPMIHRRPNDPFTHGKDGQAETYLPMPEQTCDPLHSVNMIIKLVQEHPHDITIVCTGPMSNLGMAISLEPAIVPLIKEVVAISGAFGLNECAFLNCTGDTPQSEWNVYVDPEAAKLVYESGLPVTAIGLDVATYFTVDFSDAQIARLNASKKKEAWFLSKAISFSRDRGFEAYCAVIDCMAVAAVIEPSLVTTKKFRVGVETKQGLTYGMTVRDGRHHFVWEQLPMINVAVQADYRRFLDLLTALVLE